MAPFSFSFSFDPHYKPKLLSSFLKTFCFPSSPSSIPLDEDVAAEESDLNNHHVYITYNEKFFYWFSVNKKNCNFFIFFIQVIILEIRQQAMMKAINRSRSTFMIMTEEELERLIMVAPRPQNGQKSDFEEHEEEFFSVRSCFSLCSNWEEEYWRVAVKLPEEWFKECEGWPFGLWRRRKVVVLPPLPKSPAESWIWHKRNLNNFKV